MFEQRVGSSIRAQISIWGQLDLCLSVFVFVDVAGVLWEGLWNVVTLPNPCRCLYIYGLLNCG